MVCARLEEEAAGFGTEQDQLEFLAAVGLSTTGLDQIIKSSNSLLNLQSYYTVGPTQSVAWSHVKGIAGAWRFLADFWRDARIFVRKTACAASLFSQCLIRSGNIAATCLACLFRAAPQAAGIIHSDFEKGFIVADVTKVDDFIALGSEEACKVAGKTTTQGKDYIVAGAIALSL